MTASTAAPQQNSVVPSEVGWQFVPQYYTFVNKEPHRLHCFYNKNSTFIHGTEGEEGKPCFGQQEIHKKITSLGFEDCKVFIHSVDAQSSANGGIIIQVIGEMSNHGEPWRKFVQTFFLAEQPNGYFVLNDIFRYLKEETVEGDETDEVPEPVESAQPVSAAAPEHVAPEPVAAPEPVYEQPREPSPAPPAPVVEPAPSAPVDEEPTNDVAEPAITQTPTPAPEQQHQPVPAAAPAQGNGIHTPEPEKAAPAPPREPTPTPTPAPAEAAAPAATAPVATAPPAPKPVTPAPAPAAPAAPRTWASLAATNSKKWGTVAQDSRGVTETVASTPASPATQAPVTKAQPPQRPHGQQQQRNEHPPNQSQGPPAITHAQCFVKGVVEPISQPLLTQVLTQRYGAIKDLDIVRSKACAFLEFASIDSARRAIAETSAEGGLWIDIPGTTDRLRIVVETKKERSDRPPPKPRVMNGHGGGEGPSRGAPQGFRGRGGPSRGRGGGAPPK